MQFVHEKPIEETAKNLEKIPASIKKFEYKNAKGEKIADVVIELGPMQFIPGSAKDQGQMVHRYELKFTDKTGVSKSVDLVQYLQAQVAQQTPVFFNPELSSKFKPADAYILMERMDSPMSAVVLMHEFGHARQNEDPRFNTLSELINTMDSAKNAPHLVRAEHLELLVSLIELPSEQDLQRVKDFRSLDDAWFNVKVNISLLEKKISSHKIDPNNLVPASFQEVDKMESDLIAQKQELIGIEQAKKEILSTLHELLFLPIKILERDATARAMWDLRELREKEGIDLLVDIRLSKSSMDGSEERWYAKRGSVCEGSVWTGLKGLVGRAKDFIHGPVTTASEYLAKYALGTYGADNYSMATQYKGATPTPKSNKSPNTDKRDHLSVSSATL